MPGESERPSLASFVRANRQHILREWQRRVSRLPPARNLTSDELVDHLPHLLDRIIVMLDGLERGEQVGSPVKDADRHALDRLDEGYDLDQVVREFAALRQCIFELWSEQPARSRASPLLNEAIDEAVSIAVSRFTAVRQRTLVALERVGSAALDATDLPGLLRALGGVLLETAAVDSVVVYLRRGDRLVVGAAAGLDAGQVEGEGIDGRLNTAVGRIAATREPLELRDASDSPLASPALRASGARAFFGVPMLHRGELVGVTFMASRTTYEFSSEDKLLFRTMVERATAAIVHRQLHEALDDEKRRLSAVLEALPVGVWLADDRGRVLLSNAATRSIWGEATPVPQALSEYRVFRARHADGRPFEAGDWALARVLATGEAIGPEEVEIERFDGGRATVLMSGSPVREGERLVGAVSVNLDVTARKAAERALAESDLRFRTLADNIPQLAWIADADGSIRWFNRRWYDFTGTTPDEVRGLGWRRVTHPDHVERVVAKYLAHVKRGEPWEDTFPLRGADGAYRWFLSRAEPIRDEAGRVTQWLGTNTDVTESRRLEERERHVRAASDRAAAMVDALFAAAPIGLAFFDRDFRYLRINPTLARVNGRPVEAHVGRTVRELLPETADALEGLLERVRDTGEPVVVEYSLAPPSTPDEVRDWQLSIYPVRLEGGALVGFGAAVVEITALKRALQARDEFLSVASHDLRSPLTSIRLLVETMLRKSYVGAERADWPWQVRKLEKVRDQLDRVTLLLDELLDVSRIQAGRISLELDDVDVATLLRDVAARHLEILASAGCELRVDVRGHVVGRWDQLRLEQVVGNLLTNAAKYGAGAPVEVRLATTDDHVAFSVKDHGVGIAPEDLPRIFERFERVGDRRASTGTGLGLWIVRRIVEALGGVVRVESEPGKGSTFTVELPRAPPPG